jgi:hypothetical protein
MISISHWGMFPCPDDQRFFTDGWWWLDSRYTAIAVNNLSAHQ